MYLEIGTLLESLADDTIVQRYGTKFSTISLYLTKLYVTMALQKPHQSHTAKYAKTFLTVQNAAGGKASCKQDTITKPNLGRRDRIIFKRLRKPDAANLAYHAVILTSGGCHSFNLVLHAYSILGQKTSKSKSVNKNQN